MFRSDPNMPRLFGLSQLTAIATTALVSVALLAAPATYAATKSTATKTSAKKPVKATKSSKKVASAQAEAAPSRKVIVLRGGKRTVVASRAAPVRAVFVPAKPSLAEAMGLRDTEDALALRSSVALVMDQNTNEVLFQKNPTAVLPIASITKLMTAVVVMDSHLPMDEVLTVSEEDRDTEKHSSSRLRFGTQLTRQELLLLALMSSENRAASVLGRSYPGGLPAFVGAMNRKARELGMNDSHFVDSSGLSSSNVSSAMDLARLVNAAYRNPTIREFSTQTEHEVNVLGRTQHYVSTNRLVRGGNWEIGLQKTGFISEAGQCLVMQARVNDRNVVMVFLDSVGKLSRFADATRVRNWLEHSPATPTQQRPFPSSPNLTQGPHTPQAILVSQQARGT
ncbi:murein-DD-endopeptidase. Serine peptidase. MEROPS family S11 [Cupriavidus sp. YR651]|uniref:D-alanyl-D-alanine endopeptidase n=1 Tax=Cupriavidus sp. YR651 TaxID=1855315 RepID=UPI000887A6E9|nr:murein-DD-endopeptidase. Serine peptidase. MEROPS family S11 [Cupriavidus sp. YR651]